MILMRILIYGAGVIGSLYAALFAEAGYDTNIYARGKRLEALRNNGLQYKKNQEVIKAEIRILGELPNDDIYDFVLLTVRENQLYEALTELKNNKSNAYYESDDPEKVEKEWKIMRKTAERLKRNFNFLRKQKGKLSPWKMNIFRFLPLPFLANMLVVTFGSSFGDKFMYQHAMKAPDEMRELHKQFYAYMKRMKKCGCKAKRYSDWRKKHEK